MRRAAGFSLIELVLALALSATLLTGLMLWFTRPLEALLDSQTAADAADQAERVTARLAAELADALPNSVRVACAGRCVEFLPVVSRADYRAETPGDALDFGAPDDAFDVLMPLTAAPAPGLAVVINNLDAAPTGSTSAYSAAAANNRAPVTAGTSASRIRIAPKLFPAPSPTQRFFVVGTPVSYLCAPAATGGSLRRYAGYAIQPSQPTNTALGDMLASGIVDCEFEIVDGSLLALRLDVGASASDALTVFAELRVRGEP